MRRTTVFWLALSALCGVTLFHTSQQVTEGREKLAKIEKSIGQEEESLRVLQAEWSYLNQPDRLEKMAREHLGLVPMTGRQFANLADIAPRPENPVLAQEAAPGSKSGADLADAKVPAVVRIMKPQPQAPLAAVIAAPVRKAAVPAKPRALEAKNAPARPAVRHAAPAAEARDFNDVIKGLGVD